MAYDANKTWADFQREALVFCLDRQYQDVSEDERQRICNEESELRWKHWKWEDCVSANGAEACGPEPKPN